MTRDFDTQFKIIKSYTLKSNVQDLAGKVASPEQN